VGKDQIENEQIEHKQDQSRTETGRKKEKTNLAGTEPRRTPVTQSTGEKDDGGRRRWKQKRPPERME
jgi:hypothetical protein